MIACWVLQGHCPMAMIACWVLGLGFRVLWTTAMARSGRMYLTLLAWANPVPALLYFSRSPLTTAGLPSKWGEQTGAVVICEQLHMPQQVVVLMCVGLLFKHSTAEFPEPSSPGAEVPVVDQHPR